jgi:sporulation protein YtfJ
MANENKIPEIIRSSMENIRSMVDANTVIGDPIVAAGNVTIIPVSKVTIGFAGGGSDFVSKNLNNQENPFGGGAGAGVKVAPIAFLVVKEGNVRMLPIAAPANTTTDSLVEMIPDTLDKVVSFIDSKMEKKAE